MPRIAASLDPSERVSSSRFAFEEPDNPKGASSRQGKSSRLENSSGSADNDDVPHTPSEVDTQPPPHSTAVWSKAAVIVLFVAVLYYLINSGATHGTGRLSLLAKEAMFPSAFSRSLPPSASSSDDPDIERSVQERLRKARAISYDFALQDSGGSIECSLTTGCRSWPLGIPRFSTSAGLTLTRALSLDNCWSVKSLPVQVGILLSVPIHPTYVTIDHSSDDLATGGHHAPRTMVLWGLVDGDRNRRLYQDTLPQLPADSMKRRAPSTARGFDFIPLAHFEFDVSGGSVSQTFEIYPEVRDAKIDFSVIVLEVLGKWSDADMHLCRVRVHGDPV